MHRHLFSDTEQHIRAWWPPNKQIFTQPAYAVQQRYTGSDDGFTDELIHVHRLKQNAPTKGVHKQMKYSIFRWISANELNVQRVANPKVSTTTSVEHALKYAMGRKSFIRTIQPIRPNYDHHHRPTNSRLGAIIVYQVPIAILQDTRQAMDVNAMQNKSIN